MIASENAGWSNIHLEIVEVTTPNFSASMRSVRSVEIKFRATSMYSFLKTVGRPHTAFLGAPAFDGAFFGALEVVVLVAIKARIPADLTCQVINKVGMYGYGFVNSGRCEQPRRQCLGPNISFRPSPSILECASLRASSAALLEKVARSNSTCPVDVGRTGNDVVFRVGAAGIETARLSCLPGAGG